MAETHGVIVIESGAGWHDRGFATHDLGLDVLVVEVTIAAACRERAAWFGQLPQMETRVDYDRAAPFPLWDKLAPL